MKINHLMQERGITIFWVISCVVLYLSSLSFAQQPFPGPPSGPPPGGFPPGPLGHFPGQAQPPPAIEKVSPGAFKMGEIQIHKNTRSIQFPAQVNMNKGLLEYLIVRNSGKVHESLLRTAIDPYHLQIAFLLLGFEGTDRPLRGQGDPERPKGDPIEITFEFNPRGQVLKLRAEEWVALRENNNLKDAGRMEWVYTGSAVMDGRFMAQMGGSIVAIYHDPDALVDNATPGGESDKIWFVKEGAAPPVGTPVTVIIKAKK